MSYEEIRIPRITLRAARLQEIKSGKSSQRIYTETDKTGYRDSRPFTSSRSPSHNFKLRASRPEMRQLTSPTLSSVNYVVRFMPVEKIPGLPTTCKMHIRKAFDYLCWCTKQLRSRRAVETNHHLARFIVEPSIGRSRLNPTIHPAKELPSIQPLLFSAPRSRTPVGLHLMLSCFDRL